MIRRHLCQFLIALDCSLGQTLGGRSKKYTAGEWAANLFLDLITIYSCFVDEQTPLACEQPDPTHRVQRNMYTCTYTCSCMSPGYSTLGG